MSRAPWVANGGPKRTPFGKSIPVKNLYACPAHQEALARINFCVMETALSVVTGDVGAGDPVSVMPAMSALDPTRHQIIYISNPAFGTRGLYVTIVGALGDTPGYQQAELMVQAADLLAAEVTERSGGSTPIHPRRACSPWLIGCGSLPDNERTERSPTCSSGSRTLLRGWCNYFTHGVCKRTVGYVDHYTWWRIVTWIRKRRAGLSWGTVRRR